MKRVITYGTFDLFHIGHLNVLKRAKQDMDYLVVAVSTDEFNQGKGKKTIIPFEQRMEIVGNIKCVDKVIAENNWDQKVKNIKEYSIDRFVIGDDWKGKFDELSSLCEVVYLERTENISTTSLKKALKSFTSVTKDEVINAFEILEQLRGDLL